MLNRENILQRMMAAWGMVLLLAESKAAEEEDWKAFSIEQDQWRYLQQMREAWDEWNEAECEQVHEA